MNKRTDSSGMSSGQRRSFAGWVQTLFLTLLMGLSGCGKSEGEFKGNVDENLLPEAVAVRAAFVAAVPSYQGPVEEVLGLVKAGTVNPAAYTEALPPLQKLADNPTLTAEQKQALETLIQRLKTELANRRS